MKEPSREDLEKLADKFAEEMAERRLIERELAHMASFAEMAPDPMIETDTDRTIRYCNPAAMHEFPELEKAGWSHPAFEGLTELLEMMRREEKVLLKRPIKIGERIFDQQVALLDGGPRVRLYFRDITELKRLDQLKTDFVNMVSHELRSPLTTIQASVKMVSHRLLGPVTEDQHNALDLANKNIERLARLINELLDISKIEAGKLELHCESVDMAGLVREVAKQFEPLAKERGLDFRTSISIDHLEAFVDRDKIIQIFTNLSQNALKFTEKGFVELQLENTGDSVRCTVSDSGPGISKEDLPKVFGKFQQFGTPSKSREKGTGLGLSLCKGFVELHGGSIWVESERGQGTRFIFVLPLVKAEEVFAEQMRHLFEEAVSRQQPLTLVRMEIAQWSIPGNAGPGGQNEVLHRLSAVVRSELGTESIVVVHRQGGLLVALPEMAKEGALRLADKVGKELQTHVGTPAPEVKISMASYPEDGTAAEQLLEALIGPQR